MKSDGILNFPFDRSASWLVFQEAFRERLYNTGMHFRRIFSILLILFLLMVQFPVDHSVEAQSVPFNAYDLIGAVNALRAQFGLPAFNINGSLMASAQGHSDYQAAIQSMTHYGPGGNTANERALAAGYSGRVSENIAVFTLGFDSALSTIIFEYWADDLHMNTMVNPQYLDVGAGISVGGGRVYITLDAGWPTGAYPLPTHATWTPDALATPGIASTLAFEPIIVNTPLPDGTVYHLVGFGQSLIGIAGAYGLSVENLATLNNINPDQIYAGQTLLIRAAVTPSPTAEPTLLAPLIAIATPTQETAATPTPAQTPAVPLSPMRLAGMIIVGVCVLLAILLLTVKRK
jgi:uncharacterized protein YkwD